MTKIEIINDESQTEEKLIFEVDPEVKEEFLEKQLKSTRSYYRYILQLADDFISDSLENNFSIISFIVGQGIHSASGPVIKPLLADFLKNHPAVRSFSEGKFTQGGQGVFIVKLK